LTTLAANAAERITVIGTIVRVTALLLVLAAIILLPDFNEDYVHQKLEPTFGQFKRVTNRKYPNATVRDDLRASIVNERQRVTDENAWPLMKCRSAFIMHNANTRYRKDELQVICGWGWFAD
jgi:hypothetical protein